MKFEDFQPRWRVHFQAEWPRVFDSLAAAIMHIRWRDPLWYMLDELQDDGQWTTIISIDESRTRRPIYYLQGPDYDELH